MPRILIIDDSGYARDVCQQILAGGGYEIIEANDAFEGLHAFKQHRPDAVILDLLMPGFDGRRVLREIRAANDKVPVIVNTSDTQQRTREECLALGATKVL